MGTAEYFEIIISILIGLTMITISLLFLYMLYGKEEQGSSSVTRSSGLFDRFLVFNQSMIRILLLI
ncbi:MAG: hypothetical protein ACE5NN_06280 [Candidatus Bathyarchaeia archaeon]